MEKAVIIYHSKTGRTQNYAYEIGEYLKSQGLEVIISSVQEYKEEILNGVDYLFLGCWTSGLMVICQHPEKEWKEFARKLPKLENVKVVFFTTYLILTGSMFYRMYKKVQNKINNQLQIGRAHV